jgi:hypothetical protein
MKKAKAARVPILENAFEVNLPKLMRMAKSTGSSRLVLDDGDVRTVAVLAETRLAVLLGGRQWVVDIVPVQCLQSRVRPLLKCPCAHEGNFQSLYYRGGQLACRHCHALRYRTNVAATATDRARIARAKLLTVMGTGADQLVPSRQPFKWRRKHARLSMRLTQLNAIHYRSVRDWLNRSCKSCD